MRKLLVVPLLAGLVMAGTAQARIDKIVLHARAFDWTWKACKAERRVFENGVPYAVCKEKSVQVLDLYYTNKDGTTAAAETTYTVRQGDALGGRDLFYVDTTLHYRENRNGTFRLVAVDSTPLPIPKDTR